MMNIIVFAVVLIVGLYLLLYVLPKAFENKKETDVTESGEVSLIVHFHQA